MRARTDVGSGEGSAAVTSRSDASCCTGASRCHCLPSNSKERGEENIKFRVVFGSRAQRRSEVAFAVTPPGLGSNNKSTMRKKE